MDPELKAALDELQKSWAEYKKTNDARLVAIEKGQGTSELDSRLSRIEADVAKNQKIIDEAAAKVNRMSLGTAGGSNHEALKTFNDWGRDKTEKNYFRAAATSDNNPAGGFFVLPEIEAGLDRVAGTVSVVRQISDVKSTTTNEVKINVGLGGAGSGWVGEKEPRPETDSPESDEISIPIREVYANPKVSQDELDDASFDVAAWLEDEAGISIGEREGAAFISGNTPKRPRGILAYDLVANANWAWGKLGYIATGTSGAFDATNPADKLIALQHALKSAYRAGAVFLMNDQTLASVRQMKNAMGYIWQPSLVAGVPSSLLGAPCHIDDNMPDVGAGSFSVAFGNFKRGYAIRDRAGIRVLKDPYSTKGFVEFYTAKRVGGGVRNYEAIKFLKFAAN